MQLASLPTYIAYALLPIAASVATRMAPVFFAVSMLLALLSIRLSPTPDIVYWRNFFLQFRNPAILAMLGLVALAAISAQWSIHPSTTNQESLKLALLFITLLLWLPAYPLINTSHTSTALTLGVCFALCLISLQYALPYGIRESLFPEASPLNINRAVVTQAIFAAVLLCLSRESTHPRAAAQAWTVVALSIFVGSTSYSSATMLFWGIFLSLYVGTVFFPRLLLVGSVAVAIGSLVTFPFLLMGPPSLLVWAMNLDVLSLVPRSGQFRLEIWQDYLPFIRERWITGAGFGTEQLYPFKAGSDGQVITRRHPHNLALQLWANLGLLGVFLTSCFIAFLARRTFVLRPARMGSGTALGFALFMV